MDLSDFSLANGTLPQSNSITIAASLFVVMEGARTMTNLIGDSRFSSQYGGELMGASYTGILGLLTSVIVKSPLPIAASLASIIFFVTFFHWQENMAVRYLNDEQI